VDRAIVWGVLGRFWALFSGFFTIFLISTFFSPEQQGFYYTFSSILACQIFFELGLSTVLIQFAGAECARLHWLPDGDLAGDPLALCRLLTLTRKSVLWFALASLIFVLVLVPTGMMFFHRAEFTAFPWKLPWILAVVGTAANLFLVPFWGVLSGAGHIRLANFRALVGGVVGGIGSWVAISLGQGLMSVFIMTLGSALTGWGLLLLKFPKFLHRIWWHRPLATEQGDFSWVRDIWPMQWRIALSWASGYFIFQLFTPVMFHFQGPRLAGQMGMTLAASNAILAVTLTWTNVRNVEMTKLIALKEWSALDTLFRRLMQETSLVAALLAGCGLVTIRLLHGFPRFSDRFLSLDLVGFVFLNTIVAIWINNIATYCRAHKVEPFLRISLVMGLLQGLLTYVSGKFFQPSVMVVSTFLLNILLGLPYSLYLLKRQRLEHHFVEHVGETLC